MNNIFRSFVVLLVLAIASNSFADGDASRGEKIIGSCVACHGDTGNSAVPTFPTIAGLGQKYLEKQLNDVKSGKRKIAEMTGILDSISEQGLADIAAFYAAQTTQLSGAKPLEVKVNSGVMVDGLVLGERVYRAGNLETGVPACTGCHSPRGLGNAPAGYPRLSGQHAAYLEKQLLHFRDGERDNDTAKVMRQVAEHMSTAEMKAVANFMSGLN